MRGLAKGGRQGGDYRHKCQQSCVHRSSSIARINSSSESVSPLSVSKSWQHLRSANTYMLRRAMKCSVSVSKCIRVHYYTALCCASDRSRYLFMVTKGLSHLGPHDFIVEPQQIAVCHLVHKVGVFKSVTCISKGESGT